MNATRTLNVAGLVLAAGASSRFGTDPKLLAELDGSSVLARAVAAQCAVPEIRRVVVVLGDRASQIAARVDFGRAELVVCEDWARGMSASLRCGARMLTGVDRVIVTLGDMPLLTPEIIARFVGAEPRARATYSGRPGHPVVLGPDELLALASLDGDVGARELLAGGSRVECGAFDAGLDIDTPADLERARRRAARADPR